MKADETGGKLLGEEIHELAEHKGILVVSADPTRGRLEIAFDPEQVSESDLREMAAADAGDVAMALRKLSFRLGNQGCEAGALKLEKKVEKIHGVRRATATYLGKVLCLTFDSSVAPEHEVVAGLQGAGADVSPLEIGKAVRRESFATRLRSGDLNEEISCGLGFLFLIAAFIVGKISGISWWTHGLYAGAYFFAGQEGVKSAIASLRERVLDVDVLMVLAAIGAAIVGAPFEGALLLFLFSFSNVLQRYAMERTHRAIESLLTLRPDEALVKRDGKTVKVAVEDLEIGELVVVKPGEQIPVDGELFEGETQVDESSLTGESMPVSKHAGSPLFAGTINRSGGIELTVTKRSEDSALARMVKLVAEAQAEKSKTQRFLETAEQYYAMGVILFTIAVFFVPWLLWGESFSQAFYRAMTVMVVASPCALIISTPATVLSAIGGAARRGILIKGGSHLERSSTIDIVAVDKTGTLTVGKPSLTEIVTLSAVFPIGGELPGEVSEWLRIASALESKSEHPLANAIVKTASDLGIETGSAGSFQSTAGKGAEATVGSERFLIGSERWFREMDAGGFEDLAAMAKELQEKGRTCVWLGVREGDGVSAKAAFVMADTIRPEAKDLTKDLHDAGVKKVVMLTGDHRSVARTIASEAEIDEFHAELLPEDKLRIIRQLKEEGNVMMIGDGVNDAPALAASDLGVAMGAAGTDVAMETADVVLMGDKLENIALLLRHSRRAKRVLIQNLVLASLVIFFLLIAALGFSLPLPVGVVGHEGSTVVVCLNGLRLLMISRS
ncbi:MAG: cadmium-translocating P-type ATPase [Verrucomicrobia bacterium]|jgi:Cd2+/Zn2+-exporting ATPase|nr:cadmium-translocating P-type ATPase [Verrucomicrobiota bacterium]|tara:strand:+ start:1214 stop:3574 length:2361 start_codon:yes stop_codon:yes gene_type:complete